MTAASPTLEPGAKARRRRRGMARYIEAVELVIGGNGASTVEEILGAETPAVALDPWAIEWIQAAGRAPKQPAGLEELLLQSLAFLVKAATDLARLKNETPEASERFFAVQAELMLDSAVGIALRRETHKTSDELVRLGAVVDAKMLGRLQQRVRLAVQELKRCIVDSNRGRDEDLVAELTDEAGREPVKASLHLDIGEVLTEALETIPARKPLQKVRSIRPGLRTEILLVLFVVAFIGWGAPLASRELAGGAGKEVTRDDFPASAPIAQFAAPLPSAYAVVDEGGWASYDEGQKRRFVETMGAVLEAKGYWGLLLRTPDGTTVARWFVKEGATLAQVAPAVTGPGVPVQEQFERFVP